MLACNCYYKPDNPGDYWYYPPVDFSALTETKTDGWKRCVSCKKLINIGDLCVEFTRARNPYTETEDKINGYSPHGVKLPSVFMCERCGEIFLNLNALGYCFPLEKVDMEKALKEYHKITGFNSKKDKK